MVKGVRRKKESNDMFIGNKMLFTGDVEFLVVAVDEFLFPSSLLISGDHLEYTLNCVVILNTYE